MRVVAIVVVALVGSSAVGCSPALDARLVQREQESQRYRASFEAEADARRLCAEALPAAEARAVIAQAAATRAVEELERLRATDAGVGAAPQLEALRRALAPELAAGTVTLSGEGGRLAVGLPGPVEVGAPTAKGEQAVLRRVLQALGPAAKEARLELVVPRR